MMCSAECLPFHGKYVGLINRVCSINPLSFLVSDWWSGFHSFPYKLLNKWTSDWKVNIMKLIWHDYLLFMLFWTPTISWHLVDQTVSAESQTNWWFGWCWTWYVHSLLAFPGMLHYNSCMTWPQLWFPWFISPSYLYDGYWSDGTLVLRRPHVFFMSQQVILDMVWTMSNRLGFGIHEVSIICVKSLDRNHMTQKRNSPLKPFDKEMVVKLSLFFY